MDLNSLTAEQLNHSVFKEHIVGLIKRYNTIINDESTPKDDLKWLNEELEQLSVWLKELEDIETNLTLEQAQELLIGLSNLKTEHEQVFDNLVQNKTTEFNTFKQTKESEFQIFLNNKTTQYNNDISNIQTKLDNKELVVDYDKLDNLPLDFIQNLDSSFSNKNKSIFYLKKGFSAVHIKTNLRPVGLMIFAEIKGYNYGSLFKFSYGSYLTTNYGYPFREQIVNEFSNFNLRTYYSSDGCLCFCLNGFINDYKVVSLDFCSGHQFFSKELLVTEFIETDDITNQF